jgi:hypothetical protein
VATKQTAAQDFAAWAADRDGLEPDVVDTLVTFKRDYLGNRSDTLWTTEDLHELLLGWVPRRVVADDRWVAQAVPTVRAYMLFLRDTGRFHTGSDPTADLLHELDAVADELPSAMRDTTRFDVAKAVFAAADDAGVETAADDDWLDTPLGELPAVRLQASEVLAGAARTSAVVRDLARLAQWLDVGLGEGRQVTQTGALRLTEARAAVAELGLEPPPAWSGDPAAEFASTEVRSARDVPALQMLWALALETDFVELHRLRARPGYTYEQWRSGEDEHVLAAWRKAYAAVLDLGVDYGLELSWFLPVHEASQLAVLEAMSTMYLDEPVSFSALAEAVAGASLEATGEDHVEHHLEMAEQVLGGFLDRLVGLGALARAGDEVVMTPLGRWGMHAELDALGYDAPVIEDLESMDAGELLDAVGLLPPDSHDEAVADWMSGRDRDDAVRQLVDAARRGRALRRLTAFTLLADALVGDAEALLRPWLTDGVVGPHVRLLIDLHAGVEPTTALTTQEQTALQLDAVAALVQELPPGTHVRELPAEVWSMAEATLPSPGSGPSRHPEALTVYEAVGAGHPKGKVRKAGKKAAHQARTAAERSSG